MKLLDNTIRLSATDLANHLGCRHLTALDAAAARGEIRPPHREDSKLDALRERGLAHERGYLEHLVKQGVEVVNLSQGNEPTFQRTVDAMRAGAQAVYQAALGNDLWHGRADVLLRVEQASDLGPWSYEIVDTKLARETRAGTILQLCVYSELIAEVQGKQPEWMHVVPPGQNCERESYRFSDFGAYYRLVKERLEEFVDAEPPPTYPDPVPQCDFCRWWPGCNDKRHRDDHLCLVAGITKLQRRELAERDVQTLESLARVPIPLEWRPRRGAADGYVRVREQARVQLEARERNRPVYELLPSEPGRGLPRLPEPSDDDVFFDIEGDPFAGEGGMEYLLGWATAGGYHALWSLDREGERRAFETFMDTMMERWERSPGFHIYHFAPYEPSAVKRLMGRYATREEEVDRMLRAGLFVDLYRVVKEAVLAGIERYSIKDLEAFYDFARETELRDASSALRNVERLLEIGSAGEIPEDLRRVVESYNRDDCVSTRSLRDWLASLRDESIERPDSSSGDPSEAVDEWNQRVAALKTLSKRGFRQTCTLATQNSRRAGFSRISSNTTGVR